MAPCDIALLFCGCICLVLVASYVSAFLSRCYSVAMLSSEWPLRWTTVRRMRCECLSIPASGRYACLFSPSLCTASSASVSAHNSIAHPAHAATTAAVAVPTNPCGTPPRRLAELGMPVACETVEMSAPPLP